ncbi:MAG: hypothetical protein SGI74_14625 [Oligoflexia bacterium]|nr:hypothetical protein [Oligoflexia bacterium]
MVTNQTRCVICHLSVYGDIASTDSSPFSLHENSKGTIFGNVLANQIITRQTYNSFTGMFSNNVTDPTHNLLERIDGNNNTTVSVAVDQTQSRNFSIKDGLNNGPTPLAFTEFKASKIKNSVKGKIWQGSTLRIHKDVVGNVILDGRAQALKVEGEVFIDGDLIIHGSFTGIGTIYVSGSIFIPDDITVVNNASLFASFRQDVSKADAKALQSINNGDNALRLASGENIIIGDPGVMPAGINFRTVQLPPDTRLRNYIVNRDNNNYAYDSYYSHTRIQSITSQTSTLDTNGQWFAVNRTRMEGTKNFLDAMESMGFASTAERSKVFQMDPNYLARLKPEYELPTQVCGTGKNFRVGFGSVARIDAALYAQKSIGGVITSGGNILINGGIITRNLSLLGGTGSD